MMNFRSIGPDGREGRPSSGGGGGGVSLTPPPAGLARQSSVYSLTFDEFQSTLGGFGKDFGSMNMDELLKNIWTAEETQAMASAPVLGSTGAGGAPGSGMAGAQRQGSLTLPRTLSQKKVDEVWRDLFNENGGGGQGVAGPTLNPQNRQLTLGEITLEEFLVRAGVVREDLTAPASRPVLSTANTLANGSSTSNNSNMLYGNAPTSQLNGNPGLALGFTPASRSSGAISPNPVSNNSLANGLMMNASSVRPPMQLGNTPELARQGGMRTGGIMGMGDAVVNGGLMPSMVGMGASGVTVAAVSPVNHLSSDGLGKENRELSLSPVPYVFNGGLRGRKCGGAMEKVVERRQRRMIKNRESAARSRARKQAYTMELEAEVAKLKEQNQDLQMKQAEILERQKNQVLEMINKQCGPKKRCLRRTQTGPW